VVDAAPEPGTFSMLVFGAGAGAWLVWRRRTHFRNPLFPG
jgi:uncharacterized protein (TIGR03382 family)